MQQCLGGLVGLMLTQLARDQGSILIEALIF